MDDQSAFPLVRLVSVSQSKSLKKVRGSSGDVGGSVD
jgi:hypothetical protein